MIMRHLKFHAAILAGLLLVVMFLQTTIASAGTAQQPKIPFTHMNGKKLFQKMCSSCHGEWAEGTQQGPPLIHGFYKPSHHPDRTFYRAALKGVQAHHWQFGDMPPIKGATKQDLDTIVPFVRWLQREKGLYK